MACNKTDTPPDEFPPASACCDPLPPTGYTLVWEDDFEAGALNMDDWNIEVNGDGGGNNELQYYRAENVSVGVEPATQKKCLVLTARKESFGGKPATSGRVNTRNKKLFCFARIDASIKMPHTANGLWPAFWAMGNDITQVGWPRCGEIDIVEMGNSNAFASNTQDRYFNGACHWGPQAGGNPMYANAITNAYGVQDDFHLFTLIWDDQHVATYLDLDKYPDAAPYFEMNITSKEDEYSPGNYFQKDFFILLNLAVGGNFPAIWDINNISALSSGSADMYIDYVRVYKKISD
jgi:beta-glucanase (GH16 family)